jgi:uncharacterized membrane protein
MRISLIIVGVIFLVIGGLLYLVPMQEFKVDTTTIGNGDADARTSTARVAVPLEWTFASIIIGIILLAFGLMIPDTSAATSTRNDSFNKVVESKENVEIGDGNRRKIIRERTETHTERNAD